MKMQGFAFICLSTEMSETLVTSTLRKKNGQPRIDTSYFSSYL